MSNEMDMFKDLFLQSAREHVQALNDTLLKLEAKPGELELVEELMRAGHSLKGESAAMGYEQLATLAHVIEDLFTGIGNQTLSISKELMDLLFAAFDHISTSLDAIGAAADGKELSCAEHVTKIKSLTGLKTEGAGKSASPATTKPKPAPKSAKAKQPRATKGKKAAKAEKTPEPEPPAAPLPSEPPPPAEAPATSSPDNQGAPNEQISSVTLKVEKLDQMIGISEELVLLKMQLKTNPIVQSNTQLKAEVHRLDRLVTDLQFHVMQARLFPISLALHTIPRLVRDTSQKTNKKVRLEMEGEETTVDRTIIDHLTEPFVHMVRNAIDHGIETPEVRVAAGKPAEAVVHIKAYTKENKFYTEISDDGSGIEWDKLAQAAIKKGLYTEEEMRDWDEKEAKAHLLFQEGLSASENITDISGRGVGLDAVQKAIKRLGGSIQVDTQVGSGTTFTLKLPMTLAIMQALLVQIGNQTFAMPGNEVIRSIQIDPASIQRAGDGAVIAVDGNQVPLFDLGAIFTIPETSTANQRKTVVLIRYEDYIIGCLVNRIVAEEEILVKQLGPLLKHNAHFSGATILANGAAAPIINFEGLSWNLRPPQSLR